MQKRIPDSLPISEALKSSAISLNDIGVADIAWPRAEALDVITQLHSTIWAILGGDVLAHTGRRYEYTHNNWHSGPAPAETCREFVPRSHRESRVYIERYPEPPESRVVYSLVFAPCEGRLLDLT